MEVKRTLLITIIFLLLLLIIAINVLFYQNKEERTHITRNISANSTSTTNKVPQGNATASPVNDTFFVWKHKIIDCRRIFVVKNRIIAFLVLVTPTRVNHTYLISFLDLGLKNPIIVQRQASGGRVKRINGGFVSASPDGLAFMDYEGNYRWVLKGNFTDAVELSNQIYALQLIGDDLYVVRVDREGEIGGRFLAVNLSESEVEAMKPPVRRLSLPFLLSDGQYLYVAWQGLKGIKVSTTPPRGHEVTQPAEKSEEVIRVAKFDPSGSVIYAKEITKWDGRFHSAILTDDAMVLSLGNRRCRLEFISKDGNLLSEKMLPEMKFLPSSFGCYNGLRRFDDELYYFGWNSMLGFLEILHDRSVDKRIVLGFRENNAVRDVNLYNGTLYVCGLVQGPDVNGAFIAKLNPDLTPDLNYVLAEALKSGSVNEVNRLLKKRG